jgi:hypothetical protein
MNEHDRGMMKWAPYQSLIEQATALARMRYEKGKRPRPLISSDRAREINDILVAYDGEEVDAEYYEDGYRHEIHGVIEEISTLYHYLVIEDKRIAFRDLLNLDSSKKAPIGAWAC